MRLMIAAAILTVPSLAPPMVVSKGLTTRILITGPGIDGTLALKAPEIVDRFLKRIEEVAMITWGVSPSRASNSDGESKDAH